MSRAFLGACCAHFPVCAQLPVLAILVAIPLTVVVLYSARSVFAADSELQGQSQVVRALAIRALDYQMRTQNQLLLLCASCTSKVSVYVMVSRGIGKARTQLHAAASAAAPLALSIVSNHTHT
jgi:hypothetical protein